jgi:hypothetical protein
MLYLVYSLLLLCSLVMVLYSAAIGVKLTVRLRNPLTKAVLALLIPAAAALPGVGLSMLARDVCDPYFMLDCSETGGVTLTWVYRALMGWTGAVGLGSLVVLAMGFQNRGWTPASNEWHAEGLFFRAVVAGVLTVALFFGADKLVTRELKYELSWYQKLHEWTEPLPPEGGEEGRQAYIAAYTAMQRIFGNSPDADNALPEWWGDAFKIDSEFDAGAPEVRSFLWVNRDIYALIANAASAPALDMTWDELKDYVPINPSTIGKMLQISARTNAERGWFISAMKDIRNILKIERHHRDTMDFLGYIISLRLRGYALDALEDAISKPGFYGIDSVHYPDLSDIPYVMDFKVQLRREHAEDTAEFLGQMTVPTAKEKGQAEKFKKIFYRTFMSRHALCCIKMSFNEEEQAITEGPASMAGVKGRLGDCKAYRSPYGVEYLLAAKRTVENRGAELALAAVKYYRRHQRYPVDIFKLTPDFIDSIPADPFDDKVTMAMADEDGSLHFYSHAYERANGERIGFRLKKQ